LTNVHLDAIAVDYILNLKVEAFRCRNSGAIISCPPDVPLFRYQIDRIAR
jgi:predicted metal-binding protein